MDADAWVVRHDERFRADPPFVGENLLRERRALDLSFRKEMRVVSGAGDANVHPPTCNVVRDDSPCGVHALVMVVVVPEPEPFHHVAVRGGIVVPARIGVDKTRRLVYALHRAVPLDVLRIVKSDVGMRRLETVKLPFPDWRKICGQAVRRHEFVYGVRSVQMRHHPPPVAREHRVCVKTITIRKSGTGSKAYNGARKQESHSGMDYTKRTRSAQSRIEQKSTTFKQSCARLLRNASPRPDQIDFAIILRSFRGVSHFRNQHRHIKRQLEHIPGKLRFPWMKHDRPCDYRCELPAELVH